MMKDFAVGAICGTLFWFAGAFMMAVHDDVRYSAERRETYIAECLGRGETQEACRREAAYWQVYGEGK